VVDDHRLADVGERASHRVVAFDDDLALGDVRIVAQACHALMGRTDRQSLSNREVDPVLLRLATKDRLQFSAQFMVVAAEVDGARFSLTTGEIATIDKIAEASPELRLDATEQHILFVGCLVVLILGAGEWLTTGRSQTRVIRQPLMVEAIDRADPALRDDSVGG